jgi:Flp pilus assembly protein protease CpaA
MIILHVFVAGLFLVAGWTDLREMKIRNWTNASILICTAGRFAMDPASFHLLDLAWFLGAFLVGYFVLCGLLKFGPGDVKFICAALAWFGHEYALSFLLLSGVFGGLLSFLTLALMRVRVFDPWGVIDATFPYLEIGKGKTIPYGVGMATAGLFVLWLQVTDSGGF